MSISSRYAAERITAVYRFDALNTFAQHHATTGTEYPISGDMIAVMKKGHAARAARRRTFARIENWNTK